MKCTLYTLSLVFLQFFSPVFVFAQDHKAGDTELSLNEGVLSVDQISGILGNNGPAANYMSFPGGITGAAFFSYHYFVSGKFGIGFTAGLDNQEGDLSYGRIDHGMFGIDGVTGHYNKWAYTGALEARLTYYKRRRYECYGYLGAGYTFTRLRYQFNAGITDASFFYGTSNSLVPVNPYMQTAGHFNAQLTPVGFRAGGALACFAEFGVGYKGLLSVGVSYNIRNLKAYMAGGASEQPLILPKYYPLDSNFKPIGKVGTGSPVFAGDADFGTQIDLVSDKVKEMGGNVFRVDKIKDRRQQDRYNIKGYAYYNAHADSLKKQWKRDKEERQATQKFATVIIYRPDYNHTINAARRVKLKINGGPELRIKRHQQKIIHISSEGVHSFVLKNGEREEIDVRYGNTYYMIAGVDMPDRYALFDGSLFFGRTFIERVPDQQGTLESSTVEHKAFLDASDGPAY